MATPTKSSRLALHGGTPVRASLLSYGRQSIDDDDIRAVSEVLRSDWLTCGPAVERFERAVAEFVHAPHAVAIANGTAALHAAMHALGIGPGDEVIVPSMTFAATANAVLFCGGTPVFADVDQDTLLLDAASAGRKITPRTRAIVGVDYAGQPCDYDALQELASRHRLRLAADACHALGATDRGRPAGTLAELSIFSFHPVKHITTAEGGMIVTADADLAARMRRFRNHGISTEARQRAEAGSWFYEMVDLGYNYRLSDLQCALGISQMSRLPQWLERRRAIAARYDAAFASLPAVTPLRRRPGVEHAYHLYVVRFGQGRLSRAELFQALRAEGIGVNVHYIPVHLHPYYKEKLGTGPGLCPVAEAAYERIVTLPLFPAMTDADVQDVIAAVHKVVEHHAA